jgi:hypothetical protein
MYLQIATSDFSNVYIYKIKEILMMKLKLNNDGQ